MRRSWEAYGPGTRPRYIIVLVGRLPQMSSLQYKLSMKYPIMNRFSCVFIINIMISVYDPLRTEFTRRFSELAALCFSTAKMA